MSKRTTLAAAAVALSAGLGTLHAQDIEAPAAHCGEDYLSLAKNKGYEVLVEALATDPEITQGQNREVRIYFEFDRSDNTFGFIAKGEKQQCNLVEGSNWSWSAPVTGTADGMTTQPPKRLGALRDEFDALAARLSQQYGESVVGRGERGVGGEKANRVVLFANPATSTWTIAEVLRAGNHANAVAYGTRYSKRHSGN